MPVTAFTPRFLAAGDQGLLIELGDHIDPAINQMVLNLDRALCDSQIPGLIETIPTYRSLLLIFDPLIVDSEILQHSIADILPSPAIDRFAGGHLWHVPVAYGGEEGIDLSTVAKAQGLTDADVVKLHTEADYSVYMLGFSPGFAYLGGLPKQLYSPRRLDPRARTPAGSIMIGGQQACISPTVMPSGWHILGQTAVRAFDLSRSQPFLFQPGDRIRFHAVSVEQHRKFLQASGYVPDSEALK